MARAQYRSTEAILSQLWAAIDSAELTPVQAEQVKATSDVLSKASLDVIPGETQRWKVVGLVGGIVRPAFRTAKNAASLVKIVKIVRDIGWTQLAAELAESVS